MVALLPFSILLFYFAILKQTNKEMKKKKTKNKRARGKTCLPRLAVPV